jgi:hypothetical protein
MFAAQMALQNRRRGSTQFLYPAGIESLRPALTEVVGELLRRPPTADELRILTEDLAQDTQQAEQIEARLEGTRLAELLRVMERHNVSIPDCIFILLMIVQIYISLHPPQPTPPPAPQVTVNVTNFPPEVPTDEIVDEIVERLQHERDAPEHPNHREKHR